MAGFKIDLKGNQIQISHPEKGLSLGGFYIAFPPNRVPDIDRIAVFTFKNQHISPTQMGDDGYIAFAVNTGHDLPSTVDHELVMAACELLFSGLGLTPTSVDYSAGYKRDLKP